MELYGRDSRDEDYITMEDSPFGPLCEGILSFLSDYGEKVEKNTPKIMIKCEPEQRERIEREFISEVKQFICDIRKRFDSGDPVLYQEFYCRAQSYETGVYVYVSSSIGIEDETFLVEWDPACDPLWEPLEKAIEVISKNYPNTSINICLPYHFDIGYVNGADLLVTDGNTKPLVAKMLYACMQYDEYWRDYYLGQAECPYETLLSFILDLSEYMAEDWIDVFWAHVPEDDTELRIRLTEILDQK